MHPAPFSETLRQLQILSAILDRTPAAMNGITDSPWAVLFRHFLVTGVRSRMTNDR
ncbi:MAG: hypothetical protein JO333_07625 [Verrucomicrobia bacterium]|nr:hypothetical protein [Verrucomicrobiota bacterium]